MQKYRMFQRGNGTFFIEDRETKKQSSLRTKDPEQAQRLLHAKNEAHREPILNYQMALAYISASDSGAATRTWTFVFEEIVKTKTGATAHRWDTAIKDPAFDLIRDLPLLRTNAEQFLRVLNFKPDNHDKPRVSTNVYLRRAHNFALDMGWLPKAVLPKKQWPKVQYKEKRAITLAEHTKIVERETNPERRAFYKVLWHSGASQSDVAHLMAEDIDWRQNPPILMFERMKTRGRAKQRPEIEVGPEFAAVLRSLPSSGPLFPYLRTVREADRATEFKQRCTGLNIFGVTLHSYRYSVAERMEEYGMPERYAMRLLGHNSKAIARAYARRAKVKIPSLEALAAAKAAGKVIAPDFTARVELPLQRVEGGPN